MEKEKQEEIYLEFKTAVNMTPAQLEKWLKTDESRAVGWDSGDGESIGHKSGEHIIKILQKSKASLSEADYKHMQKVNGYVKRHMAQRPEHPENSNWEYSLKNWGHNYAKK
jgi:hypothetical protein